MYNFIYWCFMPNNWKDNTARTHQDYRSGEMNASDVYYRPSIPQQHRNGYFYIQDVERQGLPTSSRSVKGADGHQLDRISGSKYGIGTVADSSEASTDAAIAATADNECASAHCATGSPAQPHQHSSFSFAQSYLTTKEIGANASSNTGIQGHSNHSSGTGVASRTTQIFPHNVPHEKATRHNTEINTNTTANKRRHHKGFDRKGRDNSEAFYTLTPLSPSPSPQLPCPPPHETPQMYSSLTHREYKHCFATLNTIFCHTAYNWLASHKFKIPMKPAMCDHLEPSDRELTEYITIIKQLIEERKAGWDTARDQRLQEISTIMDGAAEVRHIYTHVSRKKKPDCRVLGFIAAVREFCWVLKDDKNTAVVRQLYIDTEALMRKRWEDVIAKGELDSGITVCG